MDYLVWPTRLSQGNVDEKLYRKKHIYSYPDDFKWLFTITLGVKRKYPLKFWSFASQHDKLPGILFGCDNLGTTLYVWSSGNNVPCVKFNSGTCCSVPCHVSTVMTLRPLTVINGIIIPAIQVSYTGWRFQPLWKILVNGKDYPIH